jgi:hypothetical protein
MSTNSSVPVRLGKGGLSPSVPPKNPIKRPEKPSEDFPLYAHALGYWSKKIKGQILHFGRWAKVVNKNLTLLPYEEGWRAALKSYNESKKAVQEGQIDGTVVSSGDYVEPGDVLVRDVCNEFFNAKRKRLVLKKISRRMFEEYEDITTLITQQFGATTPVNRLKAKDFEELREHMESRWGPVRLTNQIT